MRSLSATTLLLSGTLLLGACENQRAPETPTAPAAPVLPEVPDTAAPVDPPNPPAPSVGGSEADEAASRTDQIGERSDIAGSQLAESAQKTQAEIVLKGKEARENLNQEAKAAEAQAEARTEGKAAELKEAANAQAKEIQAEAQKLIQKYEPKLQETLNYIQDRQTDLAEKSLAALEEVKAQLPESFQAQVTEARQLLNGLKENIRNSAAVQAIAGSEDEPNK